MSALVSTFAPVTCWNNILIENAKCDDGGNQTSISTSSFWTNLKNTGRVKCLSYENCKDKDIYDRQDDKNNFECTCSSLLVTIYSSGEAVSLSQYTGKTFRIRDSALYVIVHALETGAYAIRSRWRHNDFQTYSMCQRKKKRKVPKCSQA